GSSGTLTVQGDSSSGSGSSTLTATAGLTNQGNVVITAPGCCGALTVTLAVSGGSLTNSGTITSAGGGSGSHVLNAQLANQAGGILTVNYDLTINGASAAHTNAGTINVSSANLTLSQSGTTPSLTNTGTLSIASGRTFGVSGGDLNFGSGATFAGSGTLSLSGVTVNETGRATVCTPVTWTPRT